MKKGLTKVLESFKTALKQGWETKRPYTQSRLSLLGSMGIPIPFVRPFSKAFLRGSHLPSARDSSR